MCIVGKHLKTGVCGGSTLTHLRLAERQRKLVSELMGTHMLLVSSLGDAAASSLAWGTPVTDARGMEEIMKLIPSIIVIITLGTHV